jgi:hypothetical protein
MEIEIRNIPELALSSFLNTYGQPGEVWLSTYGTNPDQWGIPLTTVLFYPDQGILASFGAKEVDIVGDQVRGCDMEGTISTLGLWSPAQEVTFMQ